MLSVQLREAELEELYQASLENVRSAESAEASMKNEYKRVQEELAMQEHEVGELERRVREERRRREEEVDKLVGILELEKKNRNDEADRHLDRISEMREELKRVST